MKSCTLKNASSDRITELARHNINSLNNIIDYNKENNIELFRISSDLIPFGSSEINKLIWWDIFKEELSKIGNKIKLSNMRVSVHPGQYTVLNSKNSDVVVKAVQDLIYHTRILDSLGLNSRHKIILHIGGAYDNRNEAVERFIENYKKLDEKIKKRLVIENDDKIYNIEEVLEIGYKLKVPVIFDNLHNKINSSRQNMSEKYWVEQCKSTWRTEDGNQKIHYSQQAENKQKGSHSDFVSINEFMSFYKMIDRNDIDIMLEVKDKNLSCIKCINCTNPNLDIYELEKEWSRYKYTILGKSHKSYLEIREQLKNKQDFSAVSFYNIVERAMKNDGETGSCANSALHVWGYFKNLATEKEKVDFFKRMDAYQANKTSIIAVKKYLKKMAEKYEQKYLLNSYYFEI
ncbi:MAG: UV DNA damage repair endonuclease UvsE [Sedimentibacter sp.]|uniref:UV DNA damage repair endonuclease UvsE n=1 Tax=Sedimentibacter sp. TaxID=1960295 RepID=UPI0029820DB9|nr:UV DNA damage repair endonuclease UvsE [Sedimentibacter sp.]MDW5300293.1 UV DNA damage repair endonuclease UvsE [Sedimentibacter sp.]